MSKAKIAIAVVVGIVVLAVGGPFIYIHYIKDEAPKKLTLDSPAGSTTTTGAPASTTTGANGETTPTTPTTAAATAAGVDGTWKVTSASTVGYRVKEILFGQSTEGVGRTSSVTGSMKISGTTISDADFSVDMTTMKSDSSQRDGQFNNRIMETATYPTSTFKLTSAIKLDSVPADGVEITATATGKLTLKNQTKDIDLKITAKRSGDTITTLSDYKVVFNDWGINNPSAGPAKTADDGLLEIKLVFQRA